MIDQSKAIFWNSWSFRNADGIYALLEQHSDADIFCLTEVTDIDAKEVAKNGHNLAYTGLAAGENAAQVDNLAQLRSRFGDSREISYMTADTENGNASRQAPHSMASDLAAHFWCEAT